MVPFPHLDRKVLGPIVQNLSRIALPAAHDELVTVPCRVLFFPFSNDRVAKDLLAQYSKQFEQGIFTGLLSFFNNEIITAIRTSSFNPAFFSPPVTSSRYYLRALAFREGKLLHTVALRLFNKVKRKRQDPFLGWNECLDHLLAVAMTHVQRICVERFVAAAEACPDRGNAQTLRVACDLYAMNLLYEERGWYLAQNYMSQQTAKELRRHMITLAGKLSEHATDIVEAFGIPESCLQAPIAGAGKEVSAIAVDLGARVRVCGRGLYRKYWSNAVSHQSPTPHRVHPHPPVSLLSRTRRSGRLSTRGARQLISIPRTSPSKMFCLGTPQWPHGRHLCDLH